MFSQPTLMRSPRRLDTPYSRVAPNWEAVWSVMTDGWKVNHLPQFQGRHPKRGGWAYYATPPLKPHWQRLPTDPLENCTNLLIFLSPSHLPQVPPPLGAFPKKVPNTHLFI